MEYSDIKKGRINGDMYWQKYISIDTVLVMVFFFLKLPCSTSNYFMKDTNDLLNASDVSFKKNILTHCSPAVLLIYTP